MENLGEYAEEESPNTETRQMSREPVIEEMAVHSSELMQTIKGLKTELESVKKDNERILKTQEELNQILNLRKRSMYPRKISRTTRTETILMARTFREENMVLQITPIILRAARRFLTITEILLKISRERNLLNVGSVMVHIMLQFSQTERSQTAIFTPFKMK